MSFCPNCGAPINEGTKFCQSCGAVVNAAQPAAPVAPAAPAQSVQPAAPAAQPVYQQPVYQQPVQSAQPVQPVYQQSVQPVQPAYQQPVQPAYQTKPNATHAKKTNGLCIAGFILALCSLITLGATSFIGFILSVIGTILAFVKNQKGKVLGIIGIVLSLIFMLTAISLYSYLGDYYKEHDDNPSRTSRTEQPETEETKKPVNNDSTVKFVVTTRWVEIDSGRYLYFGNEGSYKLSDSFYNTDDNFSAGTYKMYSGEDAIDKLKTDYADEGMDEEDISYWIECDPSCERQNFVLIVLSPEEIWTNGEKAEGEGAVSIYAGFICTSSDYDHELKLEIFPTMAEYSFIPEIAYIENFGSNETSDTSEESFSSDVDLMGDSITGTVALYQGAWADWHEADGLDDYYESRVQKINMGTGTIINLSVFREQYNSQAPEAYADLIRQSMENEGCTGITVEETVIGGYSAYTVTGLYSDGIYLTIWYFVDGNNKLHYISVEYTEEDIVSYEMVRDTYNLD